MMRSSTVATGPIYQASCSLVLVLALSACAVPTALTVPHAQGQPPYRYSHLITGADWNLHSMQRRARGSDLWPCTWGPEDSLYCAWGDGGGFDGNDDRIGRVSLGFARLTGAPAVDTSATYFGKNIWGQVPYAEVQATFGGKVDSLIAIGGVLYAVGGLWTATNSPDPVQRSELGPLRALLLSRDLGKSWTIASTAPELTRGSFLNFGRDNATAIDAYVYLYYQRDGDDRRIYLKRIRRDRLQSPTVSAADLQYLSRVTRHGTAAAWSSNASDATAIFFDSRHALTPVVVYDAPLRRFLLTLGHDASGHDHVASIGSVGLFEAPHPWGPWSTIGYYDNWCGLGAVAEGDFLGLGIPTKWLSADGRTFWAAFSGPGNYDSFNLVQARLRTRHRWWGFH
jgi:hypothetical protein